MNALHCSQKYASLEQRQFTRSVELHRHDRRDPSRGSSQTRRRPGVCLIIRPSGCTDVIDTFSRCPPGKILGLELDVELGTLVQVCVSL
jgi:hypothetical protein